MKTLSQISILMLLGMVELDALAAPGDAPKRVAFTDRLPKLVAE